MTDVRPAAPLYTHDSYREILGCALEHGWQFIPFSEAKVPAAGKRRCLLRHDCDNDLEASLEMARIEASLGIKATYFVMLRSALYNLLSPVNHARVAGILEQGHWIGLHFDEFPHRNKSAEDLRNLVNTEREFLEAEFGRRVDVVSFHQPSQRVLDQQVTIDCINTYDRSLFRSIRYQSDSNLRLLQDGSPTALFADPDLDTLQLLIHPEWWTRADVPLEEKWQGMLARAADDSEQSLWDREDAYNTRHRIEVRREASK